MKNVVRNLNILILILLIIFISRETLVSQLAYAENERQITVHATSGMKDKEFNDDDFKFDVYDSETFEGIPEVTIEVYHIGGTLYATDKTDMNGYLYFYNVPPGEYSWEAYYEGVKISSGNLTSTGPQILVNAIAGSGDNDSNNNDFWFTAFTKNRLPLADVTIDVFDSSNQLYSSGKTDDDGNFALKDVPPGQYTWEAQLNNLKLSGSLTSTTTENGIGSWLWVVIVFVLVLAVSIIIIFIITHRKATTPSPLTVSPPTHIQPPPTAIAPLPPPPPPMSLDTQYVTKVRRRKTGSNESLEAEK
jgi:hypothetical protein